MLTSTEKKYLVLTLFFLATGSGIKAYKHAKVKIGPKEDSLLVYQDSLEHFALHSSMDSLDLSGLKPQTDSSLAFSATLPAKTSTKILASQPRTHRQATKIPFQGKLSINRATIEELTAISGLGIKTAQFIVKYRNEHGPFNNLDELLQIKGIGEKKLDKFKPFLIL